jgi:hypothetical protein
MFKTMPHCAWNTRARQPECLCIASEISAKLFLPLSTQTSSSLADSAPPQYVPVSARRASNFWA